MAKIAEREEVKPSQLLLGWVRSHKGIIVLIPGTTKVERVKENNALVDIRSGVRKELKEIVERVGVKGVRFFKGAERMLYQ